jgi:uncharacterized protein YdaU (DUF1376 family)
VVERTLSSSSSHRHTSFRHPNRRLFVHYYKRNLGDYAKKAGRLSMLQHGAYTLLMDACYDREQFPTLEQAIDWTWASSNEEIEAVEFVLSKFFVLEGDVYIQARIQQEVLEYQDKSETNKRIALDREQKRKLKQTNRAENVTSRARTVDDAYGKEHESPPNQEPLTINHKPITNNQEPQQQEQAAAVPYEAVVDLYHEVLPDLSKVQILNSKRKAAIRQRHTSVMSKSLDNWRLYFEAAFQSDFLMGRIDGKDWRADFDFLITEKAVTGVIEGKYHAKNRPATNAGQHPARAPTPAERVEAKRVAAAASDVGTVVADGSNVRPYLVEGSR